jgi:glycerate-2-kinase
VAHPSTTPADLLRACFDDAVRAVQPEAVMASLPVAPGPGSAWIIAVGKAAEGMAGALQRALEAAGREVGGGLVIGASEASEVRAPLRHLVGDHPLPADRSAAAATALGELVAQLPGHAEVHVALSGGATSLMAAPRDAMSTDELSSAFAALHRAGLPIEAMNAERRRLVRWGDGRLAEALAPRPTYVWLISDVIGDDPATIGSGPCVTVPMLRTVQHTVLASNRIAVQAAAHAAGRRGCVQRIATAPLTGEARDAGRMVAVEAMRGAREWQQQNQALREDGHGDSIRPLVLVWGGETTVTRQDDRGLGGRAQELALAAAEMLDVSPLAVTLLAAGTDGRDGPTDAAGAIVDQGSWARLAEMGDPRAALDGHDAHRLLDGLGALVRTGPTGTNVMDLVLVVVGWEDARPEGLGRQGADQSTMCDGYVRRPLHEFMVSLLEIAAVLVGCNNVAASARIAAVRDSPSGVIHQCLVHPRDERGQRSKPGEPRILDRQMQQLDIADRPAVHPFPRESLGFEQRTMEGQHRIPDGDQRGPFHGFPRFTTSRPNTIVRSTKGVDDGSSRTKAFG